jgi:hypothetical protein
MSCGWIWLALLQLPFGAVVFNVLASNGALLVALPALIASSILSAVPPTLESRGEDEEDVTITPPVNHTVIAGFIKKYP